MWGGDAAEMGSRRQGPWRAGEVKGLQQAIMHCLLPPPPDG